MIRFMNNEEKRGKESSRLTLENDNEKLRIKLEPPISYDHFVLKSQVLFLNYVKKFGKPVTL